MRGTARFERGKKAFATAHGAALRRVGEQQLAAPPAGAKDPGKLCKAVSMDQSSHS